MTGQRFYFRKAERLCDKKAISQLFENQNTKKVIEYPFILIWKEFKNKSNFPAQVLISVSTKKFKKAVDRNRTKRQVREVYKLKKYRIYETLNDRKKELAILLLFIGEEKFRFVTLEDKFDKLLNKFVKIV